MSDDVATYLIIGLIFYVVALLTYGAKAKKINFDDLLGMTLIGAAASSIWMIILALSAIMFCGWIIARLGATMRDWWVTRT